MIGIVRFIADSGGTKLVLPATNELLWGSIAFLLFLAVQLHDPLLLGRPKLLETNALGLRCAAQLFGSQSVLRLDGRPPAIAVNRQRDAVAIDGQAFRLFVIPYWFGAALLAWPLEIWIVRALIRLRRRMSRAPGTCRHCGYDLRATPEDQCRYPLNYASRLGADPGH